MTTSENDIEELELHLLSEIWRIEDIFIELLHDIRRIEAKTDQILTCSRELKHDSKSMF